MNRTGEWVLAGVCFLLGVLNFTLFYEFGTWFNLFSGICVTLSGTYLTHALIVEYYSKDFIADLKRRS